MRILSELAPVARKKYHCMASDWVDAALRDVDWSYAELRAIVKARRNGWNILPGERYVKQAIVSHGDFYVFRAIPEMHQMCLKHNLYEDT